MSRAFQPSTVPYQGTLLAAGISYFKPPVSPPNAVGITIDWNTQQYNGLGVNVNLAAISTSGQALDRITSVYVDNIGNQSNVYIVFPDTGYAITVQNDSAAWFPVVTNALNANIFTDGINNGTNETKIFFTNVYVQPFVDTQFLKVYPEIAFTSQAVGSSVFGPIASGDLHLQVTVDAGVVGNTVVFNPQSQGVLYITHMWLYGINLYSQAASRFSLLFGQASGGTIGEIILFFNVQIMPNLNQIDRRELFIGHAMQLNMQANVPYAFNNPLSIAGGLYDFGFNFTFQSASL